MNRSHASSVSLLAEWATLEKLPDVPAGPLRQLTVNLDRVRLKLSENPDGSLLLESRIKDLPMEEQDREGILRSAMKTATGRIQSSRSRLVADASASGLFLQRVLAAGSTPADVSQAVEQLANDVDVWRATL